MSQPTLVDHPPGRTGRATTVTPAGRITAANDCCTVPGVDPIIESLIHRIRPPELVWLVAGAATAANAYELTRRVYEVAGSWPTYAGVQPPAGYPLNGYGSVYPHQLLRVHADVPTPEARAVIFCRTAPLDHISELDVFVRLAAQDRTPLRLSVGVQAPLPARPAGLHLDLQDPRMVITGGGETIQQLRDSFGPTSSVEVRPAICARTRRATTHWLLAWLECFDCYAPVAYR